MPRSAVLSVHARMEGTTSDVWEDPALVQVWGPRYSVYVIPAEDLAVFTLGRLPDETDARGKAFEIAKQLEDLLGDGTMPFGDAGRALGVHPNRLRYAAATGTLLVRWDGARQPTVRSIEAPTFDPREARDELARRYLHTYGPSTPERFGAWAGISSKSARATFDGLQTSLNAVSTPIGNAWVLDEDAEALRTAAETSSAARLLPSGDSFYLLWGDERTLLVPEAKRRAALWTPRVWPGAILIEGEVVGTWRRSKTKVIAEPWIRLPKGLRDAVAEEVSNLPLPDGQASLEWSE